MIYPLSGNDFARKIDVTGNGRVSRDELIQANGSESLATKNFLALNPTERREFLKNLDEDAQLELLQSLRAHYQSAGDAHSRNACLDGIISIGVEYAARQNPRDAKELALATLKALKFILNTPEGQSPSRGSCDWDAEKILISGSTYGCVESVKVFQKLFEEAAKQLQFSYKQASYISSFSTRWAEQNSRKILKNDPPQDQDPPGHALMKLELLNGETILIDAAHYPDSDFDLTQGIPTQSREGTPENLKRDARIRENNGVYIVEYSNYGGGPVFETKTFSNQAQLKKELAKYGIELPRQPKLIKTINSDNSFDNQDSAPSKLRGKYVLFGEGEVFTQGKNRNDLFDRKTASGATLYEMRAWLQRNPR